MKDDPSLNLATRREQLRLRSAQLREQIAVRSQVFQPAFRATDRVRGGVRSVRGVRDNRALLMLGGAALAGALLVRPRAALQLGIRVELLFRELGDGFRLPCFEPSEQVAP